MKERSVGTRKPKTQTTPKGTEIPIPKKRDFLRDLRKVAEPKPEASD